MSRTIAPRLGKTPTTSLRRRSSRRSWDWLTRSANGPESPLAISLLLPRAGPSPVSDR